ncbi:MAG: rod shape-determining protein MreC [Castellaniella sp.]|uniref:rod shape-determining protein MreC n=1 Tax=Castellaniella sp. TaxID=1955812 RepID=UPI001227BA58|nr:rod shape-determining protein MreC [Castellaniella sp.]TAN27202.1 MAG: rod shape-determining protein MreC [Castellaniella sp.]
MREPGKLTLFKTGPSVEVRLVLLVVVCLVLVVVDAHWSVMAPARRALAVAIYPFERVVLAPRDALEYFDSWSHAATLARDEQDALRRQRIEMAQLSTHSAQLAAENEQLRRLLNVSERISQKSVAVEVFYVPPNAFSHRLIFNKGSRAGIEPGMPVIDEGGVVGQIIRVTPFTSEAALLIDDQVSIPVQVLRNGLRLIAFGSDEVGKLEIRYLSGNVDVKAGDTLVTSGIGGLFPAGLPVGQVEKVDHDPGTGFGMAIADPLSHPERYRHFLVLQVDVSDVPNPEEIEHELAN